MTGTLRRGLSGQGDPEPFLEEGRMQAASDHEQRQLHSFPSPRSAIPLTPARRNMLAGMRI